MVDPLSYFSFQPVLHNWLNKGSGMYYPISLSDGEYIRSLTAKSEKALIVVFLFYFSHIL